MHLPKALSTVSKLIFFNVLLFSFSASAQNLNNLSRKEYSDYLNNHPFMQRKRMTPEDIKKLPKKDRPDLAWELDYLTTMDPTTGKPERDRLFPTLDMIDQMQATLTPAVPGSSPAASWVERGPNNVGGRTRAIMWDPNDPTGKKVWAGGVTGGLWYNNDITNANSQWQSINDFWDNIAVTCIAYDPNNPDTMYVGTGEGYGSTSTSRGAGIWRSTNGGSNWTRLLSTTNFYYVNDIVVRNENGNSVVYAAVDGNFYNGTWHGAASAGLQRSTNHGSSWTQVLPSIPSNSPNYVASDLEIGPNNRLWVGTTATPYAANDRGGGRVLYSDNGTTWNTAYSHSVTNGYGRVEVAVAPSNASYVYAIIEDQNKVDGIVRTTNGGSTWSALSEPNDDDLGIPSTDFSRGQAWYDLIAAVNPTNPNTIIVGAINLHMSTNGGTSWNQISKWSNNPNMGTQPYSFVHADQHNILFKPGSSSEVIFGTDGGVFWTNNISSAATSSVISARNNGYNVTQFYAGAINPIAGSNIMVAGSQDNGSHRFSNAGINATTEISGGDGAYCFIDQTNGLDVVTSYVYNNYYYFNNSGNNYVRKIMSNSNTGSFINPADLDDYNNILYSSARPGQIYKLSNYNLSNYSLDSISITGISAMPTAIKVSPYNNSANVYVGDMSGNLIKINNANGSSPTFSNLTPPNFPNGSISSIEFGSSENEILVTFKNYGVLNVFYSNNGGASWSINKDGNLPDMPVRWALMNPNNNNEVILATEVGVWATTNFQSTSPTWTPSNSGLANVRVDMLQMRSSDNTVMAITHGRGIFTSTAWNSSTPSPTTSKVRFKVDMNNKIVSPDGVHIAGNFQAGNSNLPNWNPGGISLFDSSGTGIYEVVLELSPGTYEYKYINGNSWGNGNEEIITICNAPNGTNRQATIALGDTSLPAFCFNECGICSNNDVLYSFDFSSGLPLGWTNAGSSTNSLWEYRGPNTTPSISTGSRGAFVGSNGPISSPSASNGFMIFDSDYLDDPNGASGNGSAPAPHVGSIRTQTLDFSNESNVTIQFESYFRTFESAAGIAVSTNGGITYPDTVYVHTNLIVNQATSSAEVVRFDISSLVGGQSNVKLAFVFDGRNPLGLNGGQFQRSYYFWMIDDVKLLRTPKNDLNLFEAYHTVGNFIGRYGKIAKGISPNVTFWGNMANEGTTAQSNARVTFTGNSLSYSSSGVTLNPGTSILQSSSASFNPFQTGNYSLIATAVSDSIDGYPFNNNIQLGFEVTDSTYNLSSGINNEFLGTSSWANASDTFIVANVLELTDSVELNSVGVTLSGASTAGGKIWIRVWDFNSTITGAGGSFQNPQAPQSSLYTLTASDVANGYVQIPIQGSGNSKKLLPGTYYVGAVLFGNNNADTVRIPSDNSMYQDPNAAVIYIPFSSGFGGVYTNGNAFNLDVNVSPINPVTLPPTPTVNGDTIYKYDFNSGLPTGWLNQGDTSTSLWEYRGPNTTPNINIGSRGAFAGNNGPIQSLTASNGFMIFDSDYLDDPNGAAGTGQSPAPHVGVLYTEALNFGNQQNVMLQLESFFRTFESGAGIAFSTDGGLTYPDTIYIHDNLIVNQATANPETIRLDVSSYIGGQPNVKVAFIFDGRNPLGLNGGAFQRSYYFWMIDDISFQTSPSVDLAAFDIEVRNPNALGQHAAVPSFLYQNYDLDAKVTNQGAKRATNADVYCKTDAQSNTFIPDFPSGAISILNAGDTSGTLNFAPLYSSMFGNIDTYYLTFYPRSDSADGYTFNDTIYRSFEVTNNEYRLHTNNWNGSIGTNFNVNFGTADSIELVNEFYFSNSAVINNMTIGLGGATRVGAVAIPVIYSGSLGSGLNQELLGQPYTITAADTINGFANIPVNHTVNPGAHYVGVMLNSNNTASHITIRDDLTINQHPDAALFRINGIFYSNGNALHITLNVGQPPVLAQIDLPITWDNASTVNYDIADFDGTFSALVSDPVNSSNTVLKTDKSPTGQPWQGTILGNSGLANPIPFAQGATTISALVFSPDSGIQVRLKAEDSNNSSISVETEATTTMANGWETLNFDFSNHVSNTAALNFSNTYDKLVIFYDFFNNPSTTKSYYVDSIYFAQSTPPSLAQIDLPITWDDTINVDYTTIDFGGNTSQTIIDPNNSNNRILQSIKGAGANTWAGTILGTVNGLATNIPFAQGATSISALVFSPDSGIAVRLKVEDTLNPTISVETETFTTKANAWDTLVFDFANHVSGTSPINFSNTYNQIVIFYDFGTSPTVAKTYYLDNVYFGGTPPPSTYNVTFQVDMKNVTQSYTTPELNGTFNGWCGNCTQMSDANNDSIWDVTIQLQAGTYEYKFAADNWAIDEILTQGSFCTVTNGGFTNRVLTVTGDTTLPAVCWASCNLCPATPPTTYNVTFQVDMNTVTQGFTTPEVNGTFNNWCGNCNAMSDSNNDGVWDVTISLPADTFEFKYSADSWNIQEQLSPGLSCVVTNFGFTNRYLVITGDTTLPVVCWESCQACPPPCPAISIFATASQTVSCFGGADGGVTVNAFGGTAPYVYDWGFAQGPTISNVPANFYQVTVTDSANCVDSAWIQIHQPALPLAAETNGSMAIFEVINPNGSSFLMDFGSMAAGWGTNLETSSVLGQLVVAVDSTGDSLLCGAGIANASAINGNIAVAYRGGCEFGLKAFRAQQAGATGLVLINNGPNNVNVGAGALGSQVNIPVALINPQNGQILRNLMKQGATVYFGADTTLPMEPLCNGNMNGSIMANVQGGTSPYTFQWSNNQGARAISGLGQGNYYLTVTDAKGCTTTDTVVLNQPNPLNIGLVSATNPTSNSASNGSISVNVTGGTSPYNGVWNTNPPQNGLTASNLAVGNYSVNITDANGCSDVFSYSLCVDDTSTSSITICQGDSANIFGNYETNSGFYYQTYQTPSGCDSVIEVELVVNANPIIGSVNVTQVTGCGTNDGSISLQGVGAGAITYGLNTGQSQVNNGIFTGLFPATYVVTVTDSNGCSNNTGPLVISPFTGSPAQPSISGNTSFQYCAGDPIQTITATGGAGTLYWYNNASLSTPIDSGSTFTPPNVIGFNAYYVAETASGCQGPPTQIFVEINSIPNTPILSGAGTYCDIQSVNPVFAQGVGIIWYGDSALTVQVGSGAQLPIGTFANVGTTTAYATANSNGCSSPAASISVNVLPPVPSPTTSDVSYCDNESAIGLVANTTQGYSPRWYADASLTTLVSVSQNFTPSTVVGTSTFYLTQFDGTCESPAVTANSTVRQSPVVNSVFTTDVSVCGATDGAISINATIGNIGPKYSINNGQSFQTSSSFNNLAAAGYIILVADTFCSTTYGIATISAPGAPMAPAVLGNDTICDGDTYNGFSATAQGSGNLTWYNSPLLGLNNQVATGSSFTPSNLNVGVNTYYVTETQGICQGAASSVSIIVNGLPNVSAGIDQSICDGSSALLVATGAASYNWVGVGNNDSVTVSPTSQTTYTVIGTSVAGCSASDSMVVNINPLPTVAAGAVTPVCIDAGNFILPKGTPNGGQYSGTNVSSNTFLVSQAGIGTHVIYYNYTDANGCSNVDSTSVIVNGLPTVTLGSIANICANDAAIVLNSGTPANGNYSGSGVSSGSFDPASAGGAGTYTIVYSYTDANGCSAADTNTITVDTVPVISWVGFPTICELDGPYTLVEASPTGGVYSGTGVSAGVFDISTVTIPGSYEITYGFTDANGCIGTGSQFIDAVNNPVVNLGPDTVLCNNRPSITLDAGTGATFDWLLNGVSTGQTSQTITVDSASSGTYIVIVANADGCEGSDTVVVNYESICVGIETFGEVEGKIAVYPNPTQGIFTLEISDISALSFDVEIFNTGGQIVYSQTFANTKYVREEIDLSGLSRGIYYINLKTETGIAKYKLILN